MKDGLPYQPWAAELVKKRTANQAIDDPHAHCLPPIFPRAYVLPQYFKLVQTPGLTVLLHEFNATYRQIFTDGRPLPKAMNPTWNGYSTGHWEGDTLVVETAGFRDDLWLDMSGSPMTDAARVTERFKRPNFGTLEIEVTVNDPKAYTRPWTVTLAAEARRRTPSCSTRSASRTSKTRGSRTKSSRRAALSDRWTSEK